MAEHLIALVCTHDIPSPALSSILAAGYRKAQGLSSPESLVILSESSKASLHALRDESVTRPPVELSAQSPFLGWSIDAVADFLLENAKGSCIDQLVFLIADEKTAEDGSTLLMVQNTLHEKGPVPHSVRISADAANTAPVAVSVGSMSVMELASLVEEDGVYRGGRGPPPKKGGPAPRKALGS
ncbi:hypothetical protein N7468_006961 [Penicillium chermesinum]|uniref:DUF6924 domain-containing protein n=1 Tax=Penicillium chermesinum TaxID=63820 RepID=A0A9W9NT76_9EURO|nr:uncharacterized protein N7468_006961 [Penicillium chermesinum]KAJ5225736.1 hypothetical protein N7468_006961 [Penicillium chermesinum]KAJ6161046.1 hypothetical protein N7470_004442 [Penicillium chermesinum]